MRLSDLMDIKAMVMTRAAVQKQKKQEDEEKQLEEECRIASSPLMKEDQRTEAQGDVRDKEKEDKSKETD